MADDVRGPLHNTSSLRDKEPNPKDLDKLLKWQEERIERKLRGEYESAVFHLGEVINGNLHTPVTLSAVRVEGAKNTRKSFLASIIDPVIAPSASESHSVRTLEDILHTTRTLSSALRKTDIFTSIEAYIDRPKDPLSERSDAVDLVFRTKERGRLFMSSSTELGNNEGSANATTRIRNVLGGAETFEASVAMGTKTKRAFRGALTVPLTADMNTLAIGEVYAQERDLTSYASCWEGLKGLKAFVRRGELDKAGQHEWAYESVVRNVKSLAPTASISMREAAGQSVKSSVSHTWVYDTRDDRIAATRGVYAKVFQEIAGASLGLGGQDNQRVPGIVGLGGDAKFYRAEVEGQVSRGVGRGFSISLAARSGLLWGLGVAPQDDCVDSSSSSHRTQTTLFPDRFQLGGPTSVRSFRANGMGPRDGDDSVGGQIYYSAGVSVVSDLPTKPNWPLKLHGWVNTGRLDGVDQSIPLSQTVAKTLRQPSISAGLGLIYRFDPVRVEVNFGVPLVRSASDKSSRGVQVGMGLEFI